MTLAQARTNCVYRVLGVGGEETMRRRLLDMGFTRGTAVYVGGVSPTGGTVLVGLRNFAVALRSDAAAVIKVGEENRA